MAEGNVVLVLAWAARTHLRQADRGRFGGNPRRVDRVAVQGQGGRDQGLLIGLLLHERRVGQGSGGDGVVVGPEERVGQRFPVEKTGGRFKMGRRLQKLLGGFIVLRAAV